MTQLGFFGDPATVSVPDRLVTAFKDFKAWCAMNKIQSSQTLFMLHAATWMNSNGGKNHAVSLPFLDDKFCMHIYIYICVCVGFQSLRYGNLQLGGHTLLQKPTMPGLWSAGWHPALKWL